PHRAFFSLGSRSGSAFLVVRRYLRGGVNAFFVCASRRKPRIAPPPFLVVVAGNVRHAVELASMLFVGWHVQRRERRDDPRDHSDPNETRSSGALVEQLRKTALGPASAQVAVVR